MNSKQQHCEHPHCFNPRLKFLIGLHNLLCQKNHHYHSWHKKCHHRQIHYATLILYIIMIVVIFLIYLLPKTSVAATSFSASYDNSSLNADYTLSGTTSSKLARKDSANPDDPSDATITSPGYNDSTGAALVSGGQTMKYKISDNGFNSLDLQKGEIEFKAKFPFEMTGYDRSVGNFGIGDIDYDPSTGFYYLTDQTNHRIIKTKLDGTGWQTMGSYGSGVCQFDVPKIIHYQPSTGYVYVITYQSKKIIRTNMECTEWTVLTGINHPDHYSMYFDDNTEMIHMPDNRNYRLLKTKIDGTGWATWGSQGSGVGQFNSLTAVTYDPATEYYYIYDSGRDAIIKTKWGGEGWTTFGSYGSGVNQFNAVYDIFYDPTSEYLYLSDGGNYRIVRTKFDGTGWATYGAPNNDVGGMYPAGIFVEPSTQEIHITSTNARIIKTKIDGSKWEFFNTGLYWPSGMYHDSSTGYFYIADASNHRIVKTKFDKTGWSIYGSYGSGPNQFKSPSRLYYDTNTGYLYIVDPGNYRIVKTKFGGEGWTTLGTQGSGQGQFLGPGAIYYDNVSDKIFVWDGQSSAGVRIVRTKFDGTQWETFGSYGTGTGQYFANAWGDITYDPATEYLYVADTLNNRIVKTKWNYVGWQTFTGNGASNFNRPSGLYIDFLSEYFYITDSSNDRVVKSKWGGEGWTTVGSNGTGTFQFRSLKGIYYDSSTDLVYVNDGNNTRMARFKMDQTNWSTFNGTITETYRTLFKTTGTYPLEIFASNVTNRLEFRLSGGLLPHIIKTDPLTIAQDSWHTIKCTYNNASGEVKIFIDGEQKASRIFSTFTSLGSIGTEFYVGGEIASQASKVWGAPIDEVVLRTVSADNTKPTNPNTLTAFNESGGNIALTSGNWYTYLYPYFSWSGATDNNPDYIKDYFVYFGTNPNADPAQEGSVQIQNYFVPTNLNSGEVYYLRIKARDKEYNVADETWSPFIYKFNGGIPPEPPQSLAHSKCLTTSEDPCSGGETTLNNPTSLNRFSFTWSAPQNKPADLIGFYHWTVNVLPTSTNTNKTTNAFLPAGAYATQQGLNTLYLVAEDANGIINYQNYASVNFYAETTAPGAPVGILIFDSSNRDTKEYATTLKWTEPTQKGENFRGYEIYRVISGETDLCASKLTNEFEKVGETSSTNTGYFDGGLSSQYYCYLVKSADNAGQKSAPSTIVNLKPTGKFTSPPVIQGDPNAQVGASTITVNWQTRDYNHPCEPSVVVFESNGATVVTRQGPGQISTSINHSVKVTGLRSNTSYYFQAACRDIDGNTALSEKIKFSSEPIPAIYDINITDKTLTSVVINFKTATKTESRLYYATDEKYASSQETSLVSGEPNANQSIRLSNLTPDTMYYFRIVGTDTEGNEIRTENSFLTPPIPKIFNLQLQPIENEPTTTYDIIWSSNVPTSSAVKLSAVGKNQIDGAKADMEKEHLLRVKDLEDQTTYSITVSGRDEYGNYVELIAPNVTTPVDTRPPKIFNLTIESKTSSTTGKAQAVISWETDEPATSMIEYGSGISGDSYSQKTSENSVFSNTHYLALTELEPSGLYHLRVVSKDSSNNVGYSQDTSLITGKAQKSILDLILNSLLNSFGWLEKIFL